MSNDCLGCAVGGGYVFRWTFNALNSTSDDDGAGPYMASQFEPTNVPAAEAHPQLRCAALEGRGAAPGRRGVRQPCPRLGGGVNVCFAATSGGIE